MSNPKEYHTNTILGLIFWQEDKLFNGHENRRAGGKIGLNTSHAKRLI